MDGLVILPRTGMAGRMVGWRESSNDNWNDTCWTSLGFTSVVK